MSFDEAHDRFQDVQHYDWMDSIWCKCQWTDHWSMYCMGGEL